MDNDAFSSNRVNSWLNYLNEITDFNIKTMASSINKHFLVVEMFRKASVISNPANGGTKPLKQYTLFKKDYTFRL